jgi:hypothetical protein
MTGFDLSRELLGTCLCVLVRWWKKEGGENMKTSVH